MNARILGVPIWLARLLAVGLLVVTTAGLLASVFGAGSAWRGMMEWAGGMMGSTSGWGPMMGGSPMMGRAYPGQGGAPVPGQPGFVAGTAATPRLVTIWAGPGYSFTPSIIAVVPGETVTFSITGMGPLLHEFQVGPADAVASDSDQGTAEVQDIGMMQTRTVTYTFSGAGPFAFACHAAGHYEAGMRGTILVVSGGS